MAFHFMHWTDSNKQQNRLVVHEDKMPKEDYSIMTRVKDENQVRKVLSILNKTKHCGYSCLPPINEVYVNQEPNGDHAIWIYTRNWNSRACFLAGVLVGKGYH